jgi:Sugar efflux transporter for intercellular exchange
MSPDSIHLLFSLAIGFAFAGLLATGFQLATKQPLSFRLLESGPRPATFAVVPFLVFAAPFIIIRHIVHGRQIEGCSFQLVMVATVVAGIWSLMSGTVTIMALAAIALG